MRANAILRVAALWLPLVVAATACTGPGSHPVSVTTGRAHAPAGETGSVVGSVSSNPLGISPPAPTGGVVPSHPDAWAALVARSMVALIRGGHDEYLDRVVADAHRASGCEVYQEIAVFPRDLAAREPGLARRAIRAERARDGIDGVGHALGRMLPDVTWPGVDHPFLVGVVVAIDCPDAA